MQKWCYLGGRVHDFASTSKTQQGATEAVELGSGNRSDDDG